MPSLKKEMNPNWNGGRYIDIRGYVKLLMPDHPKADSKGYISEHRLIAEKALGKPLPDKAVVHHHSPTQLIICENQAYHRLLHQRMDAYKACGKANWRKCKYCKKYDDPKNLIIRKTSAHHRDCRNERRREWRAQQKVIMTNMATDCQV